jgi:hypothetical protein
MDAGLFYPAKAPRIEQISLEGWENDCALFAGQP